MIADNLAHRPSATYSDAIAGPMVNDNRYLRRNDRSSVDVEVKSTISNLKVNGQAGMPAIPWIPYRGDATIIVSAHGRGGADVRASVVVTQDGNRR